MPQADQAHRRPRLSLCPTAPSQAPPPLAKAWTLPETACLVLGCLLGLIFLVLGAQRCHSRTACMGSGLSGHLPSEVIYEDIEAVPVGEKEEVPPLPGDLVLEEDYDDAAEPEEGTLEEEENAGTLLSPLGVHLCALGSITLFLLYCSHSEGSALASAYI